MWCRHRRVGAGPVSSTTSARIRAADSSAARAASTRPAIAARSPPRATGQSVAHGGGQVGFAARRADREALETALAVGGPGLREAFRAGHPRPRVTVVDEQVTVAAPGHHHRVRVRVERMGPAVPGQRRPAYRALHRESGGQRGIEGGRRGGRRPPVRGYGVRDTPRPSLRPGDFGNGSPLDRI